MQRGAETGVFRAQNQPWVRPETPAVTYIIPGKIDYIESRYQNFEGASLQGLDFEIYYHHRTRTMGDFWIRHYSVFVDRYVIGDFDLVDYVGIPEYQTYSSLQWAGSGRNLSTYLIWRYTSGYQTEFTRHSTSTEPFRVRSASHRLDLVRVGIGCRRQESLRSRSSGESDRTGGLRHQLRGLRSVWEEGFLSGEEVLLGICGAWDLRF